ncbi:hypothetical protein WJX81_005724 [Elliptochloris bilobata]|uniref:Anaphase-promoting complex subunit 13 n=1 Tax=Elliptochloris bilobata TaxID=381761 RepID=A0AAW1SJJ3_9CHLO
MSTTLHYSLLREPELLDILDEAWLRGTLPDDDIPLPEGMQPPSDDQDDKDEAEPRKEPERWTDLGLHTVH